MNFVLSYKKWSVFIVNLCIYIYICEIFNLINISVYLIKLCLLNKVRSVEPASITSIYRSYIYVCNWFYISIMVLFERPDKNNNTCLCRNFSLWFLKISLRVMSFLKNTTEERQPLNWYSSSQKQRSYSIVFEHLIQQA